jgi:hypothetical protein
MEIFSGHMLLGVLGGFDVMGADLAPNFLQQSATRQIDASGARRQTLSLFALSIN